MLTQRQRADLDRHITGNYGEDQMPREKESRHFNTKHPAVAAVGCPYCGVSAGERCRILVVSKDTGEIVYRANKRTHDQRVKRYRYDVLQDFSRLPSHHKSA